MNRLFLSSSRAAAATFAATFLLAGHSAHAQSRTVVIESTDREAVNSPDLINSVSGRFKVVGRSYQVRALSAGEQQGSVPATRPYFIFPLLSAQGQSGQVVRATLTFEHPDNSVTTADGGETMTFFSVDRFSTSQLRALREPLGANNLPTTPNQAQLANLRAIFDDLGDGTSYGQLTASTDNNGKLQTVSLNLNAIRALNQAIASRAPDFKISGDLSSRRAPGNGLPRGTQERIFRGSDDSGGANRPEIKLTLTFSQDASPAPALGGAFGLGLLGTGLGGLGFAGWRRKKRR